MGRHAFQEINPARRPGFPTGVAGARTIADLRLLARRRLPNFAYEYLEGGADGELTLRRNRAALDAWLWLPRMAIETGKADLSSTLFGRPVAMPVVVAPTGFNGLIWDQGDRHLAEASAQAGIPAAQSTVSMAAIEELAAVPGLRHWFQLYAYGGEHVVERLLQRALDAGSEALVVTIDGASPGNRVWDQRNYASPGRLNFWSRAEILMHPAWLHSVLLRNGPPNFVNLKEFVGTADPDVFTVGRWIAGNRPLMSWDALRRIRRQWPRKLVVKGILRVDEALKAAEIGADAVVLSNHGGRQAEPTIAPIEILPRARAAMGPDFTILVDSGYRSGSHVAVALALGADAVMVGRSVLYGLAAGGRPGVARALDILRSELQRTMGLAGADSIRGLRSGLLTRDGVET